MKKSKKSSDKRVQAVRSETIIPSALLLRMSAGTALIAAIVLLAYLPSLNGGFVLDDNLLLTDNDLIKASDGLYRFWCTSESLDYWPMTSTTLWIEWRLWAMNSTGYHVTNLILHIVEALLIWLILRKLCIPGAFLAAVIFAVHPVNVESVAWIAQRKNLTAMLFFLLSIYCYLKYISSRHTPCAVPAHGAAAPAHGVCGVHKSRWYWLSLAAFVLAMLGKGSVVVLPVLLLGIIWWQEKKGTVPFKTRGTVPFFSAGTVRFVSDLLRIAPFFAVAAVLAAVNVWFQRHGTEMVFRTAGFTERILGAGGVVWFYLYKSLLPLGLAFIYPQWNIQANNPLWWLPLMAALIVTAVLWRYRNNWSRPFLFAWGIFCVALAPVMGFTDVGFMKYSLVADHYQHIALIASIAIASAGWSTWHRQARGAEHRAATVVAVAAVCAITFLAWRQSGLYRDPVTLYQTALDANPNCWLAYNNLGTVLVQKGRTQEAIEHYEQALRLNPDYPEAHNNLGVILVRTGRSPEAIKHYEKALELKPNYADAHYNLGNMMVQKGRLQDAIEQYQIALQLKPNYPDAHNDLGAALAKTGRPEEALEHYRQTLRLQPNHPEVYNNLGNLMHDEGRLREAIDYYQQALRLDPNFIEVYYNLALCYTDLHQPPEALAAAQKALELARLQGQTALAKQIEDWLNSYRAGLPKPPR